MEKDNVIRLLTVTDSANSSESLAAMMRNAGFPVRSANVTTADALAAELDSGTWDIILSMTKLPGINVLQAAEVVKTSGKDIPVLALVPQYDDKLALQLFNGGVRDLLLHNNQALMLQILQRELTDLNKRRDLARANISYMESEKRNRSLMESSRDAIAYVHEGMHIYVNPSYLEMFGFESAEDIEAIPVMDLIAVDDQKRFKEILKTLSKGEHPRDAFEFSAITDQGEKFSAKMEFAPAAIEGEHCTQIIIRNTATEGNEELQKELEALKRQDLVTGLFNRNYFTEQVEEVLKLIATGEKSNCTLMQIELDNFRKFEESLGPAAADLLLSDFASLLRKYFNQNDIACHYAGEVFTILYTQKNLPSVQKLAESVRSGTEHHIFEAEGQSVTTTCSIGIYQLTQKNTVLKSIMGHLEMACKKAASSGGNRIHLHTIEDEVARNEEDRKWIQMVRSALKNKGFNLVFQPIVSLHAEPGENYEVLIRMRDEDGKEIMPGQFLPPAEQAGLGREIDRWVIRESAKILVQRRAQKKKTRLFIKLCAESLRDQTLALWISKLLKAARLHGDTLVFEASEPLLLASLKETKILVASLRQLHCGFAVDHAGNESDDLGYLKHLDAQYLKLDGPLVANMARDEDAAARVKALAETGAGFNCKTIAPYVQDPTTLAALWQVGVNFIQGNYLQAPEKQLHYDFTAYN